MDLKELSRRSSRGAGGQQAEHEPAISLGPHEPLGHGK